MKVIYIKEYKKKLIFFEKAGSSLMAGFLKSLLDWKGIEVSGMISNDNISMSDSISNGENILFVRNPMERLISIFYHLGVVRGSDVTPGEKIDALDKFLDTYEERCKTSKNSHLQPQTWDFEVKPADRIFKIEDIMTGYYRLIDRYRPSSNLDFSTQNSFFNRERYTQDFGVMEWIGIPMDDKDQMFSVTLYGFILSKLNEGHHHNESHLMLGWLKSNGREDILNKLREITKHEMELFGYNKTII
jgi:hypothetical protein